MALYGTMRNNVATGFRLFLLKNEFRRKKETTFPILSILMKKDMSSSKILISNTDFIPGKEIAEILDIARGSTVRARNIGRDIFAGLKNLVGGEIDEYTKLMADSREVAIDRMIQDAEYLGADAVINVRFTTANVMQGCSEILAYGTAVKLK